ncbi:hypothetical protein EMPS_04315 [Entomortierella parvispora]|uniref:Uncharacterized protein n=1 Tax=Entomortierella parvispora TaxID=205924 RepID=A0A9P3H8G5_9FUNG|nr:hypothetical protein EMPS_04315 [Entomortierella parvispora]
MNQFQDEDKQTIWNSKSNIPAITWFQTHNDNGGPFADFIHPKDMAIFIPVAELDLYLFMTPLAPQRRASKSFSMALEGSSSSSHMEGTMATSTSRTNTYFSAGTDIYIWNDTMERIFRLTRLFSIMERQNWMSFYTTDTSRGGNIGWLRAHNPVDGEKGLW